MFTISAYIYATRNSAHETGIFWLGFRGPDCNVIAEHMVAGRTLGLRGPDLARGPEVARPWPKLSETEPKWFVFETS